MKMQLDETEFKFTRIVATARQVFNKAAGAKPRYGASDDPKQAWGMSFQVPQRDLRPIETLGDHLPQLFHARRLAKLLKE